MADNPPNEKKLTAYERWELPNLASSSNVKKESAALAIKPDEAFEVTEEIDEASLVYEPLTASQLEEIRSAAYEEGFVQGQEEGKQKGYLEGYELGLEEGNQAGLEQGKEEGKEQAIAEGAELAKTQLSTVEMLLNEALKEFEKPLEATRDQLESLLQQATKRIVEHVVRRELSEESESLIKDELEKVLTTLGDHEGRAVLMVHPDSVEAVQALLVDQRLTIKIKPDATLIEGGFVLDSQAFYVDGRVETRLNSALKLIDKPS